MSQTTETPNETTEVKAPVKAAAKKTAPAKKVAAKGATGTKESKWLAPVLKLLAKKSDGLTRAQIWEALETTDLGGVLVKNPNFFKCSTVEGQRGQVFSLTAAGVKAAAARSGK